MKPPEDYKPYTNPIEGIFSITSGEYGPNGWIMIEEKKRIIGEDDNLYVTEIRESTIPYWDEKGQYEVKSTYCLGLHKTRFVKWLPTQLSLI